MLFFLAFLKNSIFFNFIPISLLKIKNAAVDFEMELLHPLEFIWKRNYDCYACISTILLALLTSVLP